MIRTVYHFDDLGRKVPVGSYDDGSKAVGGRIFYIDSNSDEVVEFYDAQGNPLSNVVVGDTPTYYKVTSTGVSGKEKYYVYYDYEYTISHWSCKEGDTWVNENLETLTSMGSGKSNTNTIMAKDNGKYIVSSISPSNYPTVWYMIQSLRTNLTGGCDDWYLGSLEEMEELKLFMDAFESQGITNLFNTTSHGFWTSSEVDYNRNKIHTWQNKNWSTYNKSGDFYMKGSVFIRSF